MVRKCSMDGCKSKQGQGISFYGFPRSPDRRAQWAQVTGKEPGLRSAVCELHFRPEMWEQTRVDGSKKLKISAVPSRHNFKNGSPSSQCSSNSQHKEMIYLCPKSKSQSLASLEVSSPDTHLRVQSTFQSPNAPLSCSEKDWKRLHPLTNSEHNYSMQDKSVVLFNNLREPPEPSSMDSMCDKKNVVLTTVSSAPSSIAQASQKDSSTATNPSAQQHHQMKTLSTKEMYPIDNYVSSSNKGQCDKKLQVKPSLAVNFELKITNCLLSRLKNSDAEIEKLLQAKEEMMRKIEELKLIQEKTNTEALRMCQSCNTLKRRLNNYRVKIRRMNKLHKQSHDGVLKHFNKDQILAFGRKSTRGVSWSTATCVKAFQLKLKLGTQGYNYLVSEYPLFPSIRTLQKKAEEIKTESNLLDEGFPSSGEETEHDKDCELPTNGIVEGYEF